MNTKSSFDTGNWSPVNGLPAQDDIIHYLEHLLSQDPNKCFTRQQLMEAVANEFGIPTAAVEATGPESNTAAFYTRCTYLITDLVQGKRRAEKVFAKRIAFGVYQHISGNGVVSGDAAKHLKKAVRVPRKLVEQAKVSVKILKDLHWEPERIILELNTWSAEVVEQAINEVFEL